ncbi:RDD family protein [Streptomyces sp. XM4011]|uniref:RDD family protein n=1 Tax=Streptomyces sp. XM4011 TaxID=2929780 RepID=UPI0027E48B0C|nr:RDD family protein [Streptomyces sp. XM4011]
MSQLVTGDAVVLGLQPARVPTRALAIAIDGVVILTGYLLLSMVLLSAVLPLGAATAQAVQVALLILVLVGVPIAVETLTQGRSLGKLALGLRVVRTDGGPVRFRHALVRGVIGFVEILLTSGTVALIASLVSPQGRRLGDVFAGTLVVRERLPGRRALALPPPPPELAGRFAQLDLSQVPDGLWLAVRQYLTRMAKMERNAAWSLGERLAGDVAARTGAPIPPGLHPAGYLTAVAAERRRRDSERVFGRPAAPGTPPAGGAPYVPAAPAPPSGTAGGLTPPS